MNICVTCTKLTANPKFCSRSCSAITNNKTPKRVAILVPCIKCNKPIQKHKRRIKCSECINLSKDIRGDVTLQDAIYEKHHPSSAHALVRTRARAIVHKLNLTICQICGYNKHIEVAHIKAITSFPLDTMLSVINDLNNLATLCPNCHWEYDNGLLNVPLTGIAPVTDPVLRRHVL